MEFGFKNEYYDYTEFNDHVLRIINSALNDVQQKIIDGRSIDKNEMLNINNLIIRMDNYYKQIKESQDLIGKDNYLILHNKGNDEIGLMFDIDESMIRDFELTVEFVRSGARGLLFEISKLENKSDRIEK